MLAIWRGMSDRDWMARAYMPRSCSMRRSSAIGRSNDSSLTRVNAPPETDIRGIGTKRSDVVGCLGLGGVKLLKFS